MQLNAQYAEILLLYFAENKEDKTMNKNVEFNIKVTMNERWVDDFCSMLNYMQSCGNIGHSSVVGFYTDGDGDFRPKFEIDYDYEKTDGIRQRNPNIELPKIEVLFDAG